MLFSWERSRSTTVGRVLFEAVKKSGLNYMLFETSCYHNDLYAMRQIYRAGGFGPMVYSDDEGEVFLGRSVTQHKLMSDDTAQLIDEEVRHIVDRNYERSKQILADNFEKLQLIPLLIITPLVGRTPAGIEVELEAIVPKRPDMLEWRIDFFEGIADRALVQATAHSIRRAAGPVPSA